MLTTTYVTNADLDKAANELLANAHRLVFAGRFRDARLVVDMLITPGPWLLSRHGNIVQRLERLLPIISYLCDTGCPNIGHSLEYYARTIRSDGDLARSHLKHEEKVWLWKRVFDERYI